MHFIVKSEGFKFTAESVLTRLRAEGMRVTKGRRAILEVLFEADRPLSLNQIQELASKCGEDAPDYATVFRMMNSLESLQLAQKVNLQKSCSFYELRDPTKHYDHLVCRDCSKVVLLQIPCPVEETQSYIQKNYGFSRLTHSLEFFGRCPDCNVAKGGKPYAEPIVSPIEPDMRR